MARARQELDGRNSGAARHALRPQRPGAGHERAHRIRVHQSAAGAGPGSGVADPGGGAAPGPHRALRRHEAGARHPSRLSVDQAQDRIRGRAKAAQPQPGMDRHPAREPAALSQRDAGGARAGRGGFRRARQRGDREGAGTRTAGAAGPGAAADGREAARHRFAAGQRAAPGYTGHPDHRRAPAVRGGAGAGGGGGGAPRGKRQRGGDEPVHRGDPGAGQLSDLRSERAAAARRRLRGPAESRGIGAVRAGVGVQGDHAFGGARNHQPAARTARSIATAAC